MSGRASWAPEPVTGAAEAAVPPRSPNPPAMKAAITRFRITLSMDRQQNHREFAVARQGGVVLVRTATHKKTFIAVREICCGMVYGIAAMIALMTQPRAASTAEAEHPRFP